MNLPVSIAGLALSILAFATTAYIYLQANDHPFFLITMTTWALVSGICLCCIIENTATKPAKLLNVRGTM